MNRKRLYIIGIAVIVVIVVLFFIFRKKGRQKQIEYTVKKGQFEVLVNTTGELKAEKSEVIKAPLELEQIGIYNVKISDMIVEGTVVDSGDFVAALDRTEATDKLKTRESDLQKIESQYLTKKIDTSLDLRSARDELINLKYAMEEKKIALDQSKFEPPAIIRQADIELDKAKRAYEQAVKNYQLKFSKAQAEMSEISASLYQERLKRDKLVEILEKFVIRAPKGGMVIYMKDWNGNKRQIGSTISAWNPTVATLPDLSSMISKTYINEIDISKVKLKQSVKIGVDAFPDKKFTGQVINIANIGEQLPNTDAKVFEVTIKINEADSILRPAMTTNNAIITGVYENVLSVPLEAIHNNDSISFVYLVTGGRKVRQIIIPGESNENSIIIKKGLKETRDLKSLLK
ncbi:MAG: efflux RND transporter periplasmic adaptor subunit [Bacteroidia bacterium]|nr:efflux RND transporter periplasmic adaptor subunit [Bacteroidia bacterium]